MSLAIDVDLVTEVLLADGWHEVHDRSFGLDTYEYLWSGRNGMTVRERQAEGRDAIIMHGGGNYDVCAIGFSFEEAEQGRHRIAGPLTAILAVRYGDDEDIT